MFLICTQFLHFFTTPQQSMPQEFYLGFELEQVKAPYLTTFTFTQDFFVLLLGALLIILCLLSQSWAPALSKQRPLLFH